MTDFPAPDRPALARIEAAIARIETAVAARAEAAETLQKRHAALKSSMSQAVTALDELLARGNG